MFAAWMLAGTNSGRNWGRMLRRSSIRLRSAARALTQRSHLAAARAYWYAAHSCRSAARALTQCSHLAATRTDCYAAPRCPSAARALTQCSHLAVTRTDCYAAHRSRSAAHALTQHSHLGADRTIWYAARRCRSAARALTQRSHPPLKPACHCRYTACSSHLAATAAAIVLTAVRALTQRSHLAAARTGCYATHCFRSAACALVITAVRAITQRSNLAAAWTSYYAARSCRSAACALTQRSHTACRMFADAGAVSLFHRGRRLDNIIIAITGGKTGPADIHKEKASSGRRRIFFAAHPPCNEDARREGRRARAGKDQVGGPSAFRRA